MLLQGKHPSVPAVFIDGVLALVADAMPPGAEVPCDKAQLERQIASFVSVPYTIAAVCCECDRWFNDDEQECASCAMKGKVVPRVNPTTGDLQKKVFVFDIVREFQALFECAESSRILQAYTIAAEKHASVAATKDVMSDVVHSPAYRRSVILDYNSVICI